MRIFIAGATGTLGTPLVRALVARGHDVTGLTRSADKKSQLVAAGATPVLADALDAPALEEAVRSAAPDTVVHALTALPEGGPTRASHMNATNELRTTGTRNLLNAAIRAGATRFIGESMIFAYGFGDHGPTPKREDDDLQKQEPRAWLQETVDALRVLEDRLLTVDAEGHIEAIPLRYGLFYGRESPSTEHMLQMLRKRMVPTVRGKENVISWVHLDDAVSATVAAIERGTRRTIYNVVDDEPVSMNAWIRRAADVAGAPEPWSVPAWLLRLLFPYLSMIFSTQLPVDNTKAKRELGWTPQYPTSQEGLREAANVLH